MFFKNNYNLNDDNNIISFFKTYKSEILIILTLISFLIIIPFIINNNNNDNNNSIEYYLKLKGDDVEYIYRGTNYIDIGFEAYDSKGQDLTSFVEVITTINTEKIGVYETTYKLHNITKKELLML